MESNQSRNSEIVTVEDHFTSTGMDYRYWSPKFNMHFGYWRFGMNIFKREPMLDELTRHLAQHFDQPPQTKLKILDMGCGVGTPAREMAYLFPLAQVTGITKVPWQIEKAHALTPAELSSRISFEERDFTATQFDDETFDIVYSMEAMCHAPGLSKEAVIAEAARVLKPGGRLIIADGYLVQGYIPFLLQKLFETVTHNWAVDTFAGLPQFSNALGQHGLKIQEFENISFRIAPSALQTPVVSIQWLISELKKDKKITKTRWKHVVASLLAPLVGMALPYFAYGIVKATKD